MFVFANHDTDATHRKQIQFADQMFFPPVLRSEGASICLFLVNAYALALNAKTVNAWEPDLK
ncbi:MAG: hypothetical protein JSW48_08365 [Betaproteobacteria bacterium]|jgi:hypothetical protein|nr:MAG: hypothetical protein JSW48_08365 [Betaproteobacteria bacterium]